MKSFVFWSAASLLVFLGGLVGCEAPVPVVLDTPSDTSSDGDGSTESVDPASIAYEPLPTHGRVELSNLRIEWDDSFSVDWKKTAGEPYGTMLILKQPGSPKTLDMVVQIWPHEKSGTISGVLISFGGRSRRLAESGLEAYLVTLEGEARHKISNSVTLGDAAITPMRPAAEVASASTVAPVPDNLVSLPEDVTLPSGTKLMILSEGRYRNVTVSRVHPAGGVLIRWDDRDFSGVFPRSSLKIDKEVLANLTKEAAPANAMANAPAYPPPQSASQPTPQPTASGGVEAKGSPIDEGLLAPIPADLKVTPGMQLYAFWAGKWLPVTVLNPEGSGSAKIHWVGWSDSWDEVKPRAQLRIEKTKLKLSQGTTTANTPANPMMPATGSQVPDPFGSGPAGANPARSSAAFEEKGEPIEASLLAPIPADLPITPGMRLYALWAGEWLPVTVLNPQRQGSAKIHWVGWADSWDEVKPLSELRIERSKLP